jgi:Arc/MetJ-type ribon-helix-helix transcriptional regulator
VTIISMRMPDELLETLDQWASARRVTRSELLRALVEDLQDLGEPPPAPQTAAEMLAELEDAEFEALSALSRR